MVNGLLTFILFHFISLNFILVAFLLTPHHSIMSCSVTAAHQALLLVGLSRQESGSGWPFPPPGDLLDPGIKPTSPALAGKFFTAEPPGKPHYFTLNINNTHLVLVMFL